MNNQEDIDFCKKRNQKVIKVQSGLKSRLEEFTSYIKESMIVHQHLVDQFSKELHAYQEFKLETEDKKRQLLSFVRKISMQIEERKEGERRNAIQREYELNHSKDTKIKTMKRFKLSNMLFNSILQCNLDRMVKDNIRNQKCFKRIKFQLQLEDPVELAPRFWAQQKEYKEYNQMVDQLEKKLTDQQKRNIELIDKLAQIQNEKSTQDLQSNNSASLQQMQAILARVSDKNELSEIIMSKINKYCQTISKRIHLHQLAQQNDTLHSICKRSRQLLNGTVQPSSKSISL